MTEHWILVTASREWRDRQRMRGAFLAVQPRFGAPAEAMGIVHGAARGGDRMADEVAAELGWMRDLPCTAQEWDRYGRSAGHRRNARMIGWRTYGGCVAFPLGLSAGTRGCMVAAADAGIRVWNRGEPPLADGLYRVTEGTLCAGFEVYRGVVVACAPDHTTSTVRSWATVGRSCVLRTCCHRRSASRQTGGIYGRRSRRSGPWAATQDEILEGLAEILSEIAGIPNDDVQRDKSFTDDLDVDTSRWSTSLSQPRSPST